MLSDGQLLFGSVGLLAFHPSELKENDTPVQVVLSDILEFNQSLSESRQRRRIDTIPSTLKTSALPA